MRLFDEVALLLNCIAAINLATLRFDIRDLDLKNMVHGDIPPPPGDIPRVITYEYGNTTIPRKLISFAAPVHSMHGSTHLKVRLTSAIFVAYVSGICWIAIDSQPKMKALAFGNLPSSDAWILKPRNC